MPSLTVFAKFSPVAWSALALASYLVELEPGSDFSFEIDSSDNPAHPVELQGANDPLVVLKSLTAAFEAQGLAGSHHADTEQVSRLLQLAQEKVVGVADFAALSALADQLDDHFTLRSFAVGYKLTSADFAIWGALKS
jgi:glutamyl-tRNA synthetase